MLVLCRLDARVSVVGDSETVDWVEYRARNTFQTACASRGSDAWTIFAGREYSPPGEWKSYSRCGSTVEACTFLVDADKRRIVVDLPPGRWRRLYVLRIVRNVMRWQIAQLGAVFLHANCVSRGRSGIALLGPPRSGKTTLLLSMLRGGNCGFVTEDDLVLVPSGNETLLGLGWPGCARVRYDTLQLFPELLSRLSTFEHPANEFEIARNGAHALVRIFPEELASAFGCEILGESPVQNVWKVAWGTNYRLAMGESELRKSIFEAWDRIPERKAGAKSSGGTVYGWREIAFDPFLLAYFGTQFLEVAQSEAERAASMLNGSFVTHSAPMFVDKMVA